MNEEHKESMTQEKLEEQVGKTVDLSNKIAFFLKEQCSGYSIMCIDSALFTLFGSSFALQGYKVEDTCAILVKNMIKFYEKHESEIGQYYGVFTEIYKKNAQNDKNNPI